MASARLSLISATFPRVARASQLCALSQHPFGILLWHFRQALRLSQGRRADTIVGDQSLRVWEGGGDAGRCYVLGLFEKLGQQVVFCGEAAGGEVGGVQGGVGVFERVRPGQFEVR